MKTKPLNTEALRHRGKAKAEKEEGFEVNSVSLCLCVERF